MATPLIPGVALAFAQLRGLTSADVQLVASTQTVTVTGLIDVRVDGATASTLHGFPEHPGQFQVKFGARLSDGTVIPSNSMFSSDFSADFRAALVRFASSDPSSAEVSSMGGAVVLRGNSRDRVRLSVATVASSGSSTIVNASVDVYCNVEADAPDIDLASSRDRLAFGSPLAPIDLAGTSEVGMCVMPHVFLHDRIMS